jgi:hypothetical protein
VKIYGLHLLVSDDLDRDVGDRFEKIVAEVIAALEEKRLLPCSVQVRLIRSRAEFDAFIPKLDSERS